MENTPNPNESVAKLDGRQVRSLLSFGLEKPEAEEEPKKAEEKKSRPTKADDVQPTIQMYRKNLKDPPKPHE